MPKRKKDKRTYNDSRFKITFKVEGPYTIDEGNNRFLHGPCVTRCANGDWISAYQDGLDDPGHGSVIHQKRSKDGGITWHDDGIIFDECEQGFGSRNPAFGQTDDGKIVLIIQRVGLKKLDLVKGENIKSSKALISYDNGEIYKSVGIIDKNIRNGHQGCSTHLVYHDNTFYMPAFHPTGLVLYISHDDGESWPQRVMVAPKDQFSETPAYPALCVRLEGSLLFIGHLNRQIQCFGRISQDGGTSWSEIEYYDDLSLRHPVLGYAGETLICAGRNMNFWKPALSVSPDHGETWSGMIDFLPERESGGGYTALWPDGKPGRVIIVTSASGKTAASQDIVCTYIEDVHIQPR